MYEWHWVDTNFVAKIAWELNFHLMKKNHFVVFFILLLLIL